VFVVDLEEGLVPFSWGAPVVSVPRGHDGGVTNAEGPPLPPRRAAQRTWRGQPRACRRRLSSRTFQRNSSFRHAAPVQKERREAVQYSLF
jgi:hypothetical protein